MPTNIAELSQTANSNYPAGSESPSTIDDYARTYAAFIATLRDGKGYAAEAAVASAATADIGAANSLLVEITGTTSITSFGATYSGPRFVRFAGSLTLTHSASLVLPGAANIVTAAGDTAIVVPHSAGWRVVSYQRAAKPPAFSAYRSTTQSLTSGVTTKIQFQAEDFDTANAYDAATNFRFQPTVAGYYQVHATVNVIGLTTLFIYKNGSAAKRGDQASSTMVAGGVSALIYMNGSSDYLEVYALQGSGSSQNVFAGADLTYFQGFLAREA